MGLFETVQAGVATAFNAIGNLITVVTYIRKNAETYDPVTGVLTASDTTFTIPKAAIVQFDDKEIDGDIVKTNDCIVLFAGNILTFVPAITDIMTFDGKTWNVKRNLPAPKGLLNKVHVREV